MPVVNALIIGKKPNTSRKSTPDTSTLYLAVDGIKDNFDWSTKTYVFAHDDTLQYGKPVKLNASEFGRTSVADDDTDLSL